MKKKILGILLTGIIAIGLTGCGNDNTANTRSNNNHNNSSNSSSNNSSTNNNYNNSSNGSSNSSSTVKNNKYGLGETFIFDELELTFDTSYTFVTIENRYSEHNGKSVIKLGVNVKNVSSKKNSLNMFYYDLFGSQGTELDVISSYFDNNVDHAGDLKPGASYKAYFYILYDGDGKYSIDFDNYSQELSVEFDVTI